MFDPYKLLRYLYKNDNKFDWPTFACGLEYPMFVTRGKWVGCDRETDEKHGNRLLSGGVSVGGNKIRGGAG